MRSSLNAIGRVLLYSEGSTTKLLELLYGGTVRIANLRQRKESCIPKVFEKYASANGEYILREVDICGDHFEKPYLHAKTLIFSNHLDPDFLNNLLSENTPIGKTLEAMKLEVFREVLDVKQVDASSTDLIPIKGTSFMNKVYKINHSGKILCLISEYFPLEHVTGKMNPLSESQANC